MALIAFAPAARRGVPARADFSAARHTAPAALLRFCCLGWVPGELVRRLVEEHVDAEFARLRAPNIIAQPRSADRP